MVKVLPTFPLSQFLAFDSKGLLSSFLWLFVQKGQ
jgi:hypothetical protein